MNNSAYKLWWDSVDFDNPEAIARARRVAQLLDEFKGETPDPWSPDKYNHIKIGALSNESISTYKIVGSIIDYKIVID